MITPELNQEIALWRFAFRRGDALQMDASEVKIRTMASDAGAAANDLDELMWADKDGEVLLTPAPKAALRGALARGWKFRIYGVPGSVVNGHIVIAYDVVLLSPSGNFVEARAGQRDEAFRAALKKAAIEY